jgi:hypothetical protein
VRQSEARRSLHHAALRDGLAIMVNAALQQAEAAGLMLFALAARSLKVPPQHRGCPRGHRSFAQFLGK